MDRLTRFAFYEHHSKEFAQTKQSCIPLNLREFPNNFDLPANTSAKLNQLPTVLWI